MSHVESSASESAIVKRGVHPRPEQRPAQREEEREPERESAAVPRKHRRVLQGADRNAIPQHLIPSGFEMEWKRFETAGKEDGFYQAELRMNHWLPVKAEDYPALAPFGTTSGPIKMGDQMLMMREDYLCQDAREEQFRLTRLKTNANASKIKDAPEGTFDRSNHPELPRQAIRKSNERVSSDEFM